MQYFDDQKQLVDDNYIENLASVTLEKIIGEFLICEKRDNSEKRLLQFYDLKKTKIDLQLNNTELISPIVNAIINSTVDVAENNKNDVTPDKNQQLNVIDWFFHLAPSIAVLAYTQYSITPVLEKYLMTSYMPQDRALRGKLRWIKKNKCQKIVKFAIEEGFLFTGSFIPQIIYDFVKGNDIQWLLSTEISLMTCAAHYLYNNFNFSIFDATHTDL